MAKRVVLVAVLLSTVVFFSLWASGALKDVPVLPDLPIPDGVMEISGQAIDIATSEPIVDTSVGIWFAYGHKHAGFEELHGHLVSCGVWGRTAADGSFHLRINIGETCGRDKFAEEGPFKLRAGGWESSGCTPYCYQNTFIDVTLSDLFPAFYDIYLGRL